MVATPRTHPQILSTRPMLWHSVAERMALSEYAGRTCAYLPLMCSMAWIRGPRLWCVVGVSGASGSARGHLLVHVVSQRGLFDPTLRLTLTFLAALAWVTALLVVTWSALPLACTVGVLSYWECVSSRHPHIPVNRRSLWKETRRDSFMAVLVSTVKTSETYSTHCNMLLRLLFIIVHSLTRNTIKH